MTVPGAVPDEDVIEINDCVVESLKHVLHQPREGGRAGLQPHRRDCPHNLPSARDGESSVRLTFLRQLELPVRVDEVQGGKELGFQSSEALETTGDIPKGMEVIPDYLVDFAHVYDEPQFIALWLLDSEDRLVVRACPVLSNRPQRQQLVYLLVNEMEMTGRNRELLNIHGLFTLGLQEMRNCGGTSHVALA